MSSENPLGFEARVADVAVPAEVVEATMPCPAVERIFARRLDLSCLVVRDGDDRPHLLTRRRFTLEMAGAMGYGRALHANRTVAEVVGRVPTLAVSGDTNLADAGQHALSRPREWRYDDMLVEGDHGALLTVSVAELFSHLSSVHERRALHDPLTGLANRAGFTTAVGEALRRQGGPTARAAVLFVDLDEFKAVNDGLGHSAGDALLAEIGDRLRGAVRDEDVVGRLGGDEFAVLLPDSTEAAALRVADRVLELVRAPVSIGERSVVMTASVGLALQGAAGETVDEMIRNADLAMYEAKGAGKGRKVVYHSAMHHNAVSRFDLRTALVDAVARRELVVHYQAMVDPSSGAAVGAEALVRWQHPERGLMGPLEFLPMAEESGVIHQIGEWVLREACTQLSAWHDPPGRGPSLRMAVNVSVRQLEDPGFCALVAAILDEHELRPGSLVLEITESVLGAEGDAMLDVLSALSAMGVCIAVDDFGVGYSSFARLDELPVGMIKIDRRFTARLRPDGPHKIMRGLLGLAEAMGIESLVEGVETADQAAILRDLGVGQAQGFFYQRPCPADETRDWFPSAGALAI